MCNKELDELIIKYGILEKAFDHIRVIDPLEHTVLFHNGADSVSTGFHCFELLGKNKVCENCISIRAYHDDKTYTKIEYNKDNVFFIIAIPVDLPDRRVVIEIIINATSSLILETNQGNIYSEMHEVIDKMNNLVLKDSLTGVYNRRYINEKLPEEIKHARNSEKSISIIMVDIDYFKKVNDTYGHLCGDRALKKFAQILSQGLNRTTDWVARFGGEEFLICLPGANNEVAGQIAERLRKKVEKSVITYGNKKFQITASFGINTITPGKHITMNEVLELADGKLYEAKHNGRNRVEK